MTSQEICLRKIWIGIYYKENKNAILKNFDFKAVSIGRADLIIRAHSTIVLSPLTLIIPVCSRTFRAKDFCRFPIQLRKLK